MEDIKQLNLKKEFPPPQWEDWKQLVIDGLKGADYDKVMKTKTYEGITLEPIYRKEDIQDLGFSRSEPGASPYVRGNNPQQRIKEGWYVAQAQTESDLKELNRMLKDELMRGLSMVNLKIKHADQTQGIKIRNAKDLQTVLDGIDLIAAPPFIALDLDDEDIFSFLEQYSEQKGISLRDMQGAIGYDPTSEFARKGAVSMPLDKLWQKVLDAVIHRADRAPKLRCLIIDGTVYEAAGASSTQELAFVLSTAIGYIQGLMDSGIGIDSIAPLFAVKLSLGSNFFMEIAKVRAFRLIWSEMIKAWGGGEAAQKVWIHGKTAEFNKSTYDIYVNMLRTTTEAFSAVIGGVDSLEVDRFDAVLHESTELAARIARNQQLILCEEAYFGKVLDPAGGCYYIEKLTSELADKAWKLMQELEAEGGMIKCLRAGKIHKMVAATAKAKIDAVHTRRDVFVGVNMYANPADKNLLQEAKSPDLKGEVVLDDGPLPKGRAVARLEALRASISKSKPKIYLVNMGTISEYQARADFANGFFHVGGFEVISGNGYTDVEAAVAAAKASRAEAFCICSTDENYEKLVEPLCQKLDKPVILAGYPQDKVDAYRSAGIAVFIHLRANVYDTLKELAEKLEEDR